MSKKTTTTRIRRTGPALTSRSAAEAELGVLAAHTAERDRLVAKLEAELTAVRQRYEDKIEAEQAIVDAATDRLQAWAEANTGEFAERKSLDLLHGTLGFRTGNPALKTLAGWTWDRVKEKLLAGPLATYVRTKTEPDKEGIHGAYQRGELSDAGLREIGLRIVQDEAFFIEPKAETPAA